VTNLANFFDVCKQKMIYPATKSNIEYAAKLLQCGELVAFPTETVYGLGADAKNPQAIAQVFTAKGRPQNHPLIVHLGDYSQLGDWVSNIPDAAKKLAQQFWPGPMTLILPRAVHVSTLITGGQDSIGIRIPHHPVALALLNEFGSGIVAPSANRFGHVSPTCAQHVQDELGDEIAILDGGACDIGVESTIIDLTSDQVRIVRPGIITASQIEHVIMQPVLFGANINLRVSGHLASHYAPLTPLFCDFSGTSSRE
jgi:L-threonylcarbamoyladenylate synthase